MNIADILVEHSRARAHHPAIEDGERTVSYAELDRRVDEAVARHRAGTDRPGGAIGDRRLDRHPRSR